jgi:alkanesulfonate monooxygenase SsuD/methylene tetrahydromethanopterin reductase-like flavin-dependent oxidoreductase (luciferase family)
VIASMSVIAADTEESAAAQFERRKRSFARRIFGRPGHPLTDEQVDAALLSPQAAYLDEVFKYSAIGTASTIKARLDDFQALTNADEIMTAHHADSTAARIRSIEILAEVAGVLIPQ